MKGRRRPDAAAVIGASARVVAHYGAYYGFDVRTPDEELFALAAINLSGTATQAAKLEAWRQLSVVTQQLVRSATWAKLGESVFVRVIQRSQNRCNCRSVT